MSRFLFDFLDGEGFSGIPCSEQARPQDRLLKNIATSKESHHEIAYQ
jgi:hypothetical protein